MTCRRSSTRAHASIASNFEKGIKWGGHLKNRQPTGSRLWMKSFRQIFGGPAWRTSPCLQTRCVFVCRFPLSESIYLTKVFCESRLWDQNSCIHVGLQKHLECKCRGNMPPMCWCLCRNLSQRSLGLLDKRPSSHQQQHSDPTHRVQTYNPDMASLRNCPKCPKTDWWKKHPNKWQLYHISSLLLWTFTMYDVWKCSTSLLWFTKGK